MHKHVIAALALSLAVALIGSAVAHAGMGGGQISMGQAPEADEDKPGEPPSQMPMIPEFAARMMNACLGAMEGMAQMGRMMGTMGGMMGGQGGASQTPSTQQ